MNSLLRGSPASNHTPPMIGPAMDPELDRIAVFPALLYKFIGDALRDLF